MRKVSFRVGDQILHGFVRNENKLADRYTMVTSMNGRHYLIEDSEFVNEEEGVALIEKQVCPEGETVQEAPKRKRGRPKKNLG